jgi:hypothetical protein
LLLNNILAAPAFQTWIEGQPLDIPSLLYGADGRPRHSVFYLAHLGDAERMFFITLLYSAVESWMRTQTGSTALRAILYFDEIFGYIPPISNPPSKMPMLRMLKQARAFGVGQVLVTQNPVDVDYKGLSNAGTWMIGKLQTDQDKQRLLDGLESAMAGGLDRGQYDKLISTLGKRVFLLHNVHARQPQLFQTRWAMNYLAGPLTRTQIPALNQLTGAHLVGPAAPTATPLDQYQAVPLTPESDTQPVAVTPQPAAEKPAAAPLGSATRPAVPTGVEEYFLPNNLTFTQAFEADGRTFPPEALSQGLIYRPVILAQASVRFLNRRYTLDFEQRQNALVPEPDRRGMVRWEDYASSPIDPREITKPPDPRARFATLEAPLNDAKAITAMQRDFVDWVYRDTQVTVRANEALKQYAGPQVSAAEFRKQCAEAARQGRDAELGKVTAAYKTKLQTLKDRLKREQRELKQDETELTQRRLEEGSTHLENLASLVGIGSKRRLTTSVTRRRMTAQAKADVKESEDAIEEYEKQLATLEAEQEAALEEVKQRWGEVANRISDIPVTPYKKDILLDFFGVAWMPFHLVKLGEQLEELPGFRPKE